MPRHKGTCQTQGECTTRKCCRKCVPFPRRWWRCSLQAKVQSLKLRPLSSRLQALGACGATQQVGLGTPSRGWRCCSATSHAAPTLVPRMALHTSSSPGGTGGQRPHKVSMHSFVTRADTRVTVIVLGCPHGSQRAIAVQQCLRCRACGVQRLGWVDGFIILKQRHIAPAVAGNGRKQVSQPDAHWPTLAHTHVPIAREAAILGVERQRWWLPSWTICCKGKFLQVAQQCGLYSV